LTLQHSANHQFAISSLYAFQELDKMYETGQPTVTAAILAQLYVGLGLDNYQGVYQKS
jgi:hypothetical protein